MIQFMKITICGSMTFAKQMVEVQSRLEKKGHTVILPSDIDTHLSDSGFIDNFEQNLKHCREEDMLRDHYDAIKKSDAILVLNYPKNNIEGYIGTSTLMEMAIAHNYKKNIFLLNNVPSYKDYRWVHEVLIINPQVVKGDLTKIK